MIYGDSITLDRATRILEALAAKGFASRNMVFGIGSYTYPARHPRQLRHRDQGDLRRRRRRGPRVVQGAQDR